MDKKIILDNLQEIIVKDENELHNNYEIQEKIGSGGYGLIYAGKQITNKEPVAIKKC